MEYYTKKKYDLEKNTNQYKDSQLNLTFSQVNQLINASKNLRNKVIIESAYFPALRRFEIANLRFEDVNFEEGIIDTIRKRNKRAPVPVGSLYPQYMQDLKYYFEFIKRKEGYIFSSDENGKTPMEVSRINQIFHETAMIAKLVHPNKRVKKTKFGEFNRQINPHLLRHSQARHLKDLGFNIEFIKNYMGHTSIKTTMDEYGTMSIHDMKRYALEKTSQAKQIV